MRESKIKAGPKGFGFLPPLTMEKLPLIASAALRSGVLLFRVSALKIQQASVPPMQPEVISWFAVTRTWPSTGTRHHVSKFFFSAMVIILQLFYSIGICFFLITVFVAVKRKLTVRDEDLLIVQMTAGIGCVCWCMAVAVVDTMGFPVLSWPYGYNSLGFYPLHFFFCMTILNALQFCRNSHVISI